MQNVYTNHDITHQNVSVALAMSDILLGEQGVSRVHGGGFAGTIQAFVPVNLADEYIAEMNKLFGENSCKKLRIRSVGGIEITKE